MRVAASGAQSTRPDQHNRVWRAEPACARGMEYFDMTTISLADFNLSPQIVLSANDHRQLIVLAMAGLGHTADDADGLLYELERAEVVADEALPSDVVRMGSTVRYRTNGGAERAVTLVF